MGLDEAVRLVHHYCCDPETASYGPYRAHENAGPAGEELLRGKLYAFRLVEGEARPRPVDLQVFLGLSELGGILWEQEVRALSRIAGLRHPALPRLLGGGYEDVESEGPVGLGVDGAAFVVTEGAEYTLAEGGAAYYGANRREALRQFVALADGLATLHDLGLAHRNLWPAAVDVVRGRDAAPDDPPDLRLARFEMSAFIANLLSGATVDTAEEWRSMMLSQGVGALAYFSPEQQGLLLPRDGETMSEQSAKTDVYSLGAIVWEWFVGPMPAALLPTSLPQGAAATEELRDRLVALNREMRRLIGSAGLPRALGDLLHSMLDPQRLPRPTATEVVNELSRSYEGNLAALGAKPPERPYLVAYMPTYSKATLYEWGWLPQDPTTEVGARELMRRIKSDLKRGIVVHSPHGAEPFVPGGDATGKRQATTMLVGEEILWFCQPFCRLLSAFEGSGLGPPLEEALLIKYVARRDHPGVRVRADDLLQSALKRPLPEFDAIDFQAERRSLDAELRDRPSWNPLLKVTRPLIADSPQELTYQKAIDWLLELQGVELRSRQYPFVRDPDADSHDQEVLVFWDRRRDEERIHESAMLTKYARSRPHMGDFFRDYDNEDGSADVEVLFGDRPWPARQAQVMEAQFISKAGQDRIVLRSKGGRLRIPERGWVRPLDDRGSEVALRRQTDARWELFAMRTLTSQLRDPTAIRTLPHRWADAGKGLLGDGAAAVREMLASQPFFALQGPPGTGKTTVTSRAVAEYLKQEPTHRILVSAQSNFTLDNLAARILRDIGALDDQGPTDRLKDVPIGLRVLSRRAEPDPLTQPWMRDELAVRRAGQMRGHVQRLIAGGVDEALRPVLTGWQDMLDARHGVSVLPELADRLHRGANIVFATCSTATPKELGVGSETGAFDWVIVEEAAKAWPTELAIPLVRGVRWTLIGDHHQLPAHRRDEVVQFLDSCIGDPSSTVAVAGANRGEYLEAFDLFRTLFRQRPEDAKNLRRPISRLSTQFRMRPSIAQIVSRVFYSREPGHGELPPTDGLPPGGLETLHDDLPAPLLEPGWLAGNSLVWLDTGAVPECKNEPHWSNVGEAAIVASLVEHMRPFPRPNQGGFSREPLAVLTPYRQQLEVLRRSRILADYPVSTIHAFQGREADIVLVSLVRDTVSDRSGSNGPTPWDGFGHLSRPDLINVLFSRARRHLVVVGDFAHFAAYEDGDGDFWRLVCRGVELYGEVLPAADALMRTEAW